MTMPRCRLASLFLAVVAVPLWAQAPSALDRFPKTGPLVLHEEQLALPRATVLVGTFDVAEDPAKPAGRHLNLNVMVLPAKAEHPLPDPIVLLAGGPGQAATTLAPQLANSWMRQQRDIVLVDQRGTGKSNPLQVALPGSADDLQGYLDVPWREDLFKRGLAELQKVADLTKYTTALGMDDVDAVCRALGFDKVNLVGGSYGTRAALIYMKRHKEHIRCAVLDGVAPIAFKNPLYHAQAGQDGFEALRQEVLLNPEYRSVFGDIADDLSKVIAQLEQKPAAIEVSVGRQTATVQLTRDGFAESLRHMLYDEGVNRMVPSLLHAAARGNLEPFASSALQYNRAVHDVLAYGLLMSVTNGEDLPRIREEEIGPATKGTFLGDVRVRGQLAIGAFWPRAVVPDADEPVSVDTPVLLLSGTHDPVTPPRWGAEAASHLPHSLHVVVPGCHGVGTKPGVDKLVQQFIERASVEGLDLKLIERVKLAKIRLPKQD